MNNAVIFKDEAAAGLTPAKLMLALPVKLAVAIPERQALLPVLGQALAPPQAANVAVPAVQLSDPAGFPVLREGAGPLELTVPFGFEHRKINAATFKALAGRPKDNLLRQHGRVWQLVEDSELIDLADKTVVFKLGPVQIYS